MSRAREGRWWKMDGFGFRITPPDQERWQPVLAAVRKAAGNAKVSYSDDGSGAEGDSVGDVLFCKSRPSCKLSFTWRKGSSSSFRLGDPGYETLFPVDSGLSW